MCFESQVCFLLLLSLLKCTDTYLGWNDPTNGDHRAKGDRNGGGYKMCHILCPWYVFFLFLIIFLIQYSGQTDPTNGQGHEMHRVSCP